MKILITGASGFIGSFLCEEALKRGMETWAGMRQTSSRRYLQNEKLQFAFLDMTNPDVLASQLAKYKQRVERWDVIIHAAGATKCLDPKDFDKHNYDCTRNLVEQLAALDMLPAQFLYVSSLSVLGAIREQMVDGRYTDLVDTDTPQPNTAYGASKVKSEEWLRDYYSKLSTNSTLSTMSKSSIISTEPTISTEPITSTSSTEATLSNIPPFSYTIFRPTGVYGPREKDYFLMAKNIKAHIDFAAGFKPQVITFVYVRDLVAAIFAAIGKGDTANGKTYHVSDGCNYNSRAFSDLIQKELGVKHVLHITAPLWFLRAVCAVGDAVSRLTKKQGTLNNDKYHILSQRNWQCDISPICNDLGYQPEWPLDRGVKECVQWYKENKWL